MRRIGFLPLLLLSLIAAYILVRLGAGFLMDWYWYQEVGYPQVLLITLAAQWSVGVGVGVAVAGFILLNAALAIRRKQFVLVQETHRVINLKELSLTPSFVKRGAAAASVLLGLFAGVAAASKWIEVMQFFHAQPFGKTDPLLGRDISFYVFRLPLYSTLIGYAFLAVVVSLLAAAAIYILAGQFSVQGKLSLSIPARRHLLALLSLLLLLMAVASWLEVFNMMTLRSGLFAGPGYADVYARMPLARGAIVVHALLAGIMAAAAFTRLRYAVPVSAGVYVLLLVVRFVYPPAVQKVLVAPSELERETPFILHNIQATREAFNLNGVDQRELTGERTLSRQDVDRNSATVKNIRLWDHGPLLDTFSQIQEIRTYYDFVAVDNDRYLINGQLQQVMLSARELNSQSLPNRNWINEHLSFTHGFGATLGPVNRVTAEGLPVLLVKDIPPQSAVAGLQITRPEIYFGELTHTYAIAMTKAGEFNYPAGEKNVYRNYDGSGGVPINSFFRRLAFASALGSTDILLSNLITPQSRLLYHRNLQERIARVAPYLRLDRDPYLVISQGRLIWLQDAYTVSSRYPYAEPVNGVGNYIRNSVKVLVDAYHGTIQFYSADPADPVLQTYAAIFPGIFRPLADMPGDLRQHLRYPEDIFSIQAAVYSTYHMAQPQIFYNKEDQWEVPALMQGQQLQRMNPYYTIMRLPGEKREEFILMLPFNPRDKDNLAAWMAARGDGDAYGKLVVYLFPKQRLVYGPEQINARINQDPEISRQISLWDQRGSQVIQGTLLVIPIEETLIYVRPIYIRAEGGKIPELKRVVVAYENRIAMEETLEQSLAKIFGGEGAGVAAQSELPLPREVAQPGAENAQEARARLLQDASQAYDRAMRAQREGNWSAYGEEIRRVGEILRQLAGQN
ncbi:MAG: UPF0182 family protein [Acidobacteria bacterium]|nr:UPF0182 family protein [Acidobacteriota bacterium]